MIDTSGDARFARRRFLKASAGAAAVSLLAKPAAAQSPSSGAAEATLPSRPHEQGPPLSPYGVPSPFEKGVVRVPTDLTPTSISSWDFTPLQDLHGIITPNGLFFERNHGGVPQIDPKAHRLLVHGLVDNSIVFTMDDLMRYPAVSEIHFLECSGNGLTEWKKPTGKTVQVTHGLVSCVEWTGVRVATILKDLGVKSGAAWRARRGERRRRDGSQHPA